MQPHQCPRRGRHGSPTVEQLEERLTLSASGLPDVLGPSLTSEAATYTLQLDAAGQTVDQWQINWGDGTLQTVAGTATSVCHVYADGPAQFTITATATEHTALNPVQWTTASGGNGHFYALTSGDPTDWHTAETQAVSLGGHLASITSAAEQSFIVDTFLTGATERSIYWIGLTDEAVEGTFVWSSGEPVTYTSWQSGEPNDFHGNEDYTTVNWHYGHQVGGGVRGAWNDTPLFGSNSNATGPEPYRGIMEFNALPVGRVTVRSLNVTVQNVAPTAAVSGPGTGLRGQPLSFTLSANDVSAADQAAGFTYAVDWDGDGVTDVTYSGPSGMTLTHNFAQEGTYVVQVTATDRDGGTSTVATTTVLVTVVALQPDASNPSQTVLVVAGTPGNDTILLDKHGNDGSVTVWVNGQNLGVFNPTAGVVVYGYDGNDLIVARGYKGPVQLYGGAGDDVLVAGFGNSFLSGGDGNDILLGGPGQDVLDGGPGHDVLIGGGGRDTLIGTPGCDLLLGGLGHDLFEFEGDPANLRRDAANLHSLDAWFCLQDSVRDKGPSDRQGPGCNRR
jgi:Ca2+-binding RTX toxin-like protein